MVKLEMSFFLVFSVVGLGFVLTNLNIACPWSSACLIQNHCGTIPYNFALAYLKLVFSLYFFKKHNETIDLMRQMRQIDSKCFSRTDVLFLNVQKYFDRRKSKNSSAKFQLAVCC